MFRSFTPVSSLSVRVASDLVTNYSQNCSQSLENGRYPEDNMLN